MWKHFLGDGMFFLVLLLGGVLGSDPQCLSRFDYDEKMLMKLLRLEDTVAKFDARVTELVAMFAASEDQMTESLAAALADFSKATDKTAADLEARATSLFTSLTDNVDERVQNSTSDVQKLLDRVDAKTSVLINRVAKALEERNEAEQTGKCNLVKLKILN